MLNIHILHLIMKTKQLKKDIYNISLFNLLTFTKSINLNRIVKFNFEQMIYKQIL